MSIKISKDVVDPEDVEMLEDLVLSDVKQAIDEGKKMAEGEMGKLTAGLGGMGLPGMVSRPYRGSDGTTPVSVICGG